MRGRKTQLTLTLSLDDQLTLHAWQRRTTIRAGLAARARVLLLVAAGLPITEVAARSGLSRPKIYKWTRRYQQQGLAGLRDKPRRGGRATA
jgi:hypothetical protein